MKLAAVLVATAVLALPAPVAGGGNCTFPGGAPQLAWSPDGGRLAGILSTGACPAATVAVTDGSSFRMLPTDPTFMAIGIDWSPDGARLAVGFHRSRSSLVVYDVAGETRSEIAQGVDPAWSPDGRQIAYSHRTDGVHVVSPDGGGDRRIGPGRRPAWSPDSARLAYERHGSVFLAGSDGTDELLVTSGESPSWSPDGSSVAVLRAGSTYVHPLDGTPERRLGPGRLLQWSAGADAIALIDAMGVVRLVDPSTGATRRASEDAQAAALRPQGDRLATLLAAGRRPEIYFAEPAGARPMRVSPSQCGLYTSRCVNGSDRGDRIVGTQTRDVVFPGAGDDRVWGRGGDDRIDTAYGRDRVLAGPGNDVVNGHGNDDLLYGGLGRDHLAGGNGEDRADGGPGADVISVGGDGLLDHVRCGHGVDVVVADAVDRTARDCELVRRLAS
jgi:hypothetical protein